MEPEKKSKLFKALKTGIEKIKTAHISTDEIEAERQAQTPPALNSHNA